MSGFPSIPFLTHSSADPIFFYKWLKERKEKIVVPKGSNRNKPTIKSMYSLVFHRVQVKGLTRWSKNSCLLNMQKNSATEFIIYIEASYDYIYGRDILIKILRNLKDGYF